MRTYFICFILFISFAYSQYSLKTEHLGGAKDAKGSNTFRATLLKNGSTVSTVERKLPYDVPFPSVHINETTGIFILSYTFDGFVEVYNGAGKKLWEENFFKEMGPNYERTITVALGSNVIAFLTSDVTLPNASVHRYTVSGRKEWETALPHSMGYEIAMSNDERTIVAGSYFVLEDEVRTASTLLDMEGTVRGTAAILFRSASFNDKGDLVALASDREMVVYDVNARKELARAARRTDGIISNIVWSGSSLYVQESTVRTTPEHEFYFADPTVIRYSDALKELSRRSMAVERFKTSSLRNSGTQVELQCDTKTFSVDR